MEDADDSAAPVEAAASSRGAAPPAAQQPAAPWTSADGTLTIGPEDVRVTNAVLQALLQHDELWKAPFVRPVRKSLATLSARMEAEKAASMELAAEAKKGRAARQEALARKQLDKQFIEKSKLRAGRLLRLKELAAQGEGSAEGLLIPDGAVVEDAAAVGLAGLLTDGSASSPATAATSSSSESAPPLAAASDPHAGDAEQDGEGASRKLHGFRSCYICKVRFQELHHYYDQLCPGCAPLNYAKRLQSVDLSGRIALVTGARVKIGFFITLKLLRGGARVIATSRFPHDTAARFAAQPDYHTWKDRLDIYGLDFRDLRALESFCAMLYTAYSHLDIIINNACQTVRRPAAFYAHLMETETKALSDLPPEVAAPLAKEHAFRAAQAAGSGLLADASPEAAAAPHAASAPAAGSTGGAAPAASNAVAPSTALAAAPAVGAVLSSAAMTQLPMAPEDALAASSTEGSSFEGKALFPTGLLDTNGQQLDLRRTNSWVLRLHEISTPELLEVFAINAMAPFIINARLRGLMSANRPDPPAGLPRVTRASTGAVPRGLSSAAAEEGGDEGDEEGMSEPAAKRARVDKGSSSGGNAPKKVPGSLKLLGEVAPPVPASLCRFIVNVSAMEGRFSRFKNGAHAHTNMAKSALNMMTRTSAGDLADQLIFMTAVDTGWINDENPLAASTRNATAGFQTPLDEIDAAARVLDPVFAPLLEAQRGDGTCKPVFGAFFKDYFPSEW